MAYGTVNADQIQSSVTGVSLGAGNATNFKNRIINGAMVIDQRNAGASVTITTANQYTVDRWQAFATQSSKYTAQQNAGSVTPPVGYTNYLGITSSSAYSVVSSDYFFIRQGIEGFNIADLNWGTASAKTITVSFQVYSSLTGTFGGSLTNSAGNRSYPFTYTVSSANTWTTISVTIVGDTTGTWNTTTGGGIYLYFGLGMGSTNSGTAGAWSGSTYYSATGATSVVGTSGATFYVTGVQLEVGSSATGFEYRDYGRELILCQRYYEMSYNTGTVPSTITRNGGFFSNTVGGALNRLPFSFKVVKRTAPTVTLYASESGASANVTQWTSGGSTGNVGATAYDVADEGVARVEFTTSSLNVFASWQFTASAEL
jgi:hypothetical protein